MEKLKRTSRFDTSLSSYLDEEKQEYVYEYIGFDENGKEVPMKQTVSITEDNIEIIRMLDDFDHYETMQNRYKKENEDVLIHKNIISNEDGEEYRESMFDKIPDKKAEILSILFSEEVDDSRYDKFMQSLRENQRNLIYDHINLHKSFAEISIELGGDVTVNALKSRWNKIKNKAVKFFNK